MPTTRPQSHWHALESLFDVGSLGGLTDGELLACFESRQGKVAHEAFRILVERHGPMVLGVCRSVIGEPHEAEDAFQATFLVLVRRAGSIQRRDTIGPWLHGVAGHVARRARGRAIRRKRREVEIGVDVPDQDRPADGLSGLEKVIHEEVGRLPAALRAPLVLCCLEGLSYELAAVRLGVRESTVRGRLYRARKRLASRLRGRGITTGVFTVASEPARLTFPPLSSSILESTAQFCVRWSSLNGLFSAGAASAQITSLAEGVIRIMMLQSIKLSIIVLLMAAGAVGTVVLAQHGNKNARDRQAESAATSVGSHERQSTPRSAHEPAVRPPVTSLKVIEILKTPIDMQFPQGITLELFLKHIKQQTKDAELPGGIPIFVNPLGLQDLELSMTSKVKVDVKQKPVAAALKALDGLGLTAQVADGFLMIDSESGYRTMRIELHVREIDRKLDRVLEALERLERAK